MADEESHPLLPAPPTPLQWTICGKVRTCGSLKWWECCYLIFGLIGSLICFAMVVDRLVNTLEPNSSDFTFALLLIFTIVFCVYYIIHSILTESADELLVFLIVNGIILFYSLTSFKVEGIKDPAILYRMIVVVMMCPILIGFGIWLCWHYFTLNDFVTSIVGNNINLQKAYKWFSICSSLLKFNLQLQMSMVILVLGNQSANLDKYQEVILPTGICLTLIFAALGFIALRIESIALVCAFYIIGTPQPVYVATKLNYAAFHREAGVTLSISTLMCGCLALIVWLLLVGCTAYFAKNHFGRGLKELHSRRGNVPSANVNAQSIDFEVPT